MEVDKRCGRVGRACSADHPGKAPVALSGQDCRNGNYRRPGCEQSCACLLSFEVVCQVIDSQTILTTSSVVCPLAAVYAIKVLHGPDARRECRTSNAIRQAKFSCTDRCPSTASGGAAGCNARSFAPSSTVRPAVRPACCRQAVGGKCPAFRGACSRAVPAVLPSFRTGWPIMCTRAFRGAG